MFLFYFFVFVCRRAFDFDFGAIMIVGKHEKRGIKQDLIVDARLRGGGRSAVHGFSVPNVSPIGIPTAAGA